MFTHKYICSISTLAWCMKRAIFTTYVSFKRKLLQKKGKKFQFCQSSTCPTKHRFFTQLSTQTPSHGKNWWMLECLLRKKVLINMKYHTFVYFCQSLYFYMNSYFYIWWQFCPCLKKTYNGNENFFQCWSKILL